MICGWCANEGELAGPASRCQKCGGAHWNCTTPTCHKMPVADDRDYCSTCGAHRSAAPQPDGLRQPTVTCLRHPVNVEFASLRNPNEGFYLRAAEALQYRGRLLVAGARDVFLTPGLQKGAQSTVAPGTMLSSTELLGVSSLGVPQLLHRTQVLFGSDNGIFALSLHDGQIKLCCAGRALMTPLLSREESAGAPVHIWCAVLEAADQASLVHYIYHPGACLQCGEFESITRQPCSADVIGAFEEPATLDSISKIYLINCSLGDQPAFVPIDVISGAALTDLATPVGRITQPSASAGRMRPWLPEKEALCWISRTGKQEDGLTVVETASEQFGRELEISLSSDCSNRRLLPPQSRNEVQRKSVDGVWSRIGRTGNLRLAWSSIEEKAQLISYPLPSEWNEEWLMQKIGIRPLNTEVGPVMPTAWGVSTSVAISEPQKSIAIIYVDFPVN